MNNVKTSMSAEHNTKENLIIVMEFYFKGNNIQYNTKTELLVLLLLFFLHLFYNVTLNYLNVILIIWHSTFTKHMH